MFYLYEHYGGARQTPMQPPLLHHVHQERLRPCKLADVSLV